MTASKNSSIQNKIIPEIIFDEAKIALSHYPELKNVVIEFRLKSSLTKSFMKAQPKFRTLFKSKTNRAYIILMSEVFEIDSMKLPIKEIPKDVLIGWLGHELGHVMDYTNRNSLNLLYFGVRYLFSSNYIREAERMADTYAVTHGNYRIVNKSSY